MPYEIKEARRQGFRPIIGMPGKSGTGKTESALRLARGLVGQNGRITVCDTEEGRARLYAPRFDKDPDAPAGAYSVVDIGPPFSSANCLEAYRVAEAASDIVIFDSISHEWNGEGGCLETLEKVLDRIAGSDYQNREKSKMRAWNEVGIEHNKFVLALTRCKVPVICCFRAKDKVVLDKEPGQKMTIATDEDAPVQRKDLIHEMTVIFAMEARPDGGGYFALRKRGPESLAKVILSCGERITAKHGEEIVKWCECQQAPGHQAPASSKVDPLKAMKAELWAVSQKEHMGDVRALAQFLYDETIMGDQETLETLTPDRLKQVLEATKKRLNR